jgi:polysaccharide biosynthesis/export protein
MIICKKSLRFAFSILLMLNFSTTWAAGASGSGSGSVSVGTVGSGSGLSPSLSNSGSPAAIQLNTPSVTAAEPSVTEGRVNAAAKLQEQDAKVDSAPNQVLVKEINEPQFKSEFQVFVAQSVGHALPMYGYDLFHEAPNTFAPVDHIPVTPDYTIGPGDELLVHLWGQVEANQSVVVDRDGMISLPKVGPVSVVGVRYQNLQAHLKAAVGKMFRNFDLDVSLGKLRSIQVFVVGQAARPGNYTVSSLSTLVNALFASGGPSAKGSMRHIQLKRSGKVITEFDMYDLLLKGDKSKDVQLLPGDVIYIPTIGAMTAISGSVNTPAIFELKGNETLSDLLNLAGGFTNVAAGQKVSVERIHERKIRKVDEFLLDKDGLAKPIQDGDVVTVNSISPRFDNAVKLQGNVAAPMRYTWKAGMRINDLLNDNNSMIPAAYWAKQNSGALNNRYSKKEVNWDYAVVQRLNEEKLTTSLIAFNLGKAIKGDLVENMLLQPGDVVTIFSAEEALPKTENDVVLKGSIFSPSNRRFVWREGMRISDLIPNAKGLIDYYDYWLNSQENKLSSGINWGYANIVRLQPRDLTRTMITFDLGKVLLGNDSANNLALLPGDEITIFTNDEIQVPAENRNSYVRLEGELVHPGVYQVLPGETLRQLVMRVGGTSPQAYLFGSEFSREATRQMQQKRLDEIIARMEADIQHNAARSSSAALSKDDVETAKVQAQSQEALVAKMRQVKATGRIVLEMPEYAVEMKNLPDLVLEDGDRLYIPSVPSTVSVMGTVYNQNAFIYRKGQTVSDYLGKAGGPTRDGDANDVYVVRVDGLVFSKRQGGYIFGNGGFDGRQALPGDTVIVPEKLEKYNLTKDFKDWTQIFYQFALGIASFKVLGVF